MVRIYNDLEEKPEMTIISVEEYLKNYREYYPEGIKNLAVNIDSAEFGDIIPADDGGYYSYVYADKFFSGKFQNKNIYRSTDNLVFKITFNKQDNLFTDFKIENIDRSGLAFLQSLARWRSTAVPVRRDPALTRKGSHLSALSKCRIFFGGQQEYQLLTLETNYHEWQIDPVPAYSGGVGLDYFFGDHIGLGVGAGYGDFATTYSLNGNFSAGNF